MSHSDSPRPQGSIPPSDEVRAERRAKLNDRVRLDLWKAVGEASQVMSHDEIREFVEETIGEIVSDEP